MALIYSPSQSIHFWIRNHSIYRSKAGSDTSCLYALTASSVVLKFNLRFFLKKQERPQGAECGRKVAKNLLA